jgi:hypothetical protein
VVSPRPDEGFRREATTDWLQPFDDGMRGTGRPELGTLVLAVVHGLITDIEATGDVSRADQAVDDFPAAHTLSPHRASRVGLAESARRHVGDISHAAVDIKVVTAVNRSPRGRGPGGR